ncbi:hypothetical protein N7530_003295 [Penicillium desertorum]|uniref:Uncharacterized protein n=1 Tax=Penicillium desertorum TaxID=1303715 RepID=A0A9X0BPS6_9EURO|nr:hypothetical protein N7530_003295 [Penicillium desertorum]
MHNTTTTPANCAPMTPTGSPPKEIYLFWALQDAHNGPWFFLAWICVLQYAAPKVVPMPVPMASASASVVVSPSLPVFRPSLPSTKPP